MMNAYKVKCWTDPSKASIAEHHDGHERFFNTWESADRFAHTFRDRGQSATVIGPTLESCVVSERRAI